MKGIIIKILIPNFKSHSKIRFTPCNFVSHNIRYFRHQRVENADF